MLDTTLERLADAAAKHGIALPHMIITPDRTGEGHRTQASLYAQKAVGPEATREIDGLDLNALLISEERDIFPKDAKVLIVHSPYLAPAHLHSKLEIALAMACERATVILTGYAGDMDEFIADRPLLKSRFPAFIKVGEQAPPKPKPPKPRM